MTLVFIRAWDYLIKFEKNESFYLEDKYIRIVTKMIYIYMYSCMIHYYDVYQRDQYYTLSLTGGPLSKITGHNLMLMPKELELLLVYAMLKKEEPDSQWHLYRDLKFNEYALCDSTRVISFALNSIDTELPIEMKDLSFEHFLPEKRLYEVDDDPEIEVTENIIKSLSDPFHKYTHWVHENVPNMNQRREILWQVIQPRLRKELETIMNNLPLAS